MKYRVLIHQRAENDFTASVLELPNLVTQGKTEEEAVSSAQIALVDCLSHSKVVTLEVNSQPAFKNAFLKQAGSLKDDPTFDEFMEEMQRYRREVNEMDAAQELLEEAA